MSPQSITWKYDDCNGMSDTFEASHCGIQLCVVSYTDATLWCADKDGTRVEGVAESVEAAQRCAVLAGSALLKLFEALADLQDGHVTPVQEEP